jgi:hypothetical protein
MSCDRNTILLNNGIQSTLSHTVGMQAHLLNDSTRLAQHHAELDASCSQR